MIMRNADKQHSIQLDGLLNVKGYVNGMITANKISYLYAFYILLFSICEKDADPSFLFLNLEGLANSTNNKENKKRKEYGDITFRFVP
jgi:hypothetical protein